MSRHDRDRATIDRRELVSLSGAAVAAALLPLPTVLDARPAVEPALQTELMTDWSIDDMWGACPRYAEAIGYGRPRGNTLVAVAAIDAQFLA